METLQTILNHRTIRKYQTRIIEPEILNLILKTGTRASTTGNMQVYSIIVSTDEKIKEDLWVAHFKQDMVKQAPVVLTFCADFNRFNMWCELRDAKAGYDNFLSFYTASIDALLVAQNIAIAAESYGLGICYLGTTTYMAESIIKILNLPKYVVPVTTLVIGYPSENPELTDRLPLEGVVHYQKYQNYSEEQINQIYSEKEALPSTKELISINKTQNLAQIFTDKRYTKKDNVNFSKSFIKVVENQNFMNNDM
jgi:FMN reductase (NADPH)